MFNRKLRHVVVICCTVMLMSSQFAVASYVCPKMSPMDMSAMDMSPDCMHEMETGTSPLCKAHCNPSPQSDEMPSVTFAPFMVQTQWSLFYPDTFEPASSRTFNNSLAWQADSSPPLRIQFRVFRI
jgi:hypothetical protein